MPPLTAATSTSLAPFTVLSLTSAVISLSISLTPTAPETATLVDFWLCCSFLKESPAAPLHAPVNAESLAPTCNAPSLFKVMFAPSTTALVVSLTILSDTLPAPAKLKLGVPASSDVIPVVPPLPAPAFKSIVLITFCNLLEILLIPVSAESLISVILLYGALSLSRNPSSLSVPLLVIPPATLTLLISPVVSALTFNSDAEILPSSPSFSSSFSSSFPSLSIICAVFCTSILLMATPMPTPALAPLAENVTIAFVTLVSLLASILIMPLSFCAVNLASVSTITLL